MKRALQILLALSFVTMFIVSPVAAATSQGLEWGIDEGEQWNFDITSVSEGVTEFDEVMYFESTGGLTTIPNILDDWALLPKPTFDITWANGTSLGWSALIFIFYAIAVDTWAVPIGNYTLLGELYEDHPFYNGTVYDSASYWGMELTEDFLGNEVTIHIDFLKTDGFLAHWTVDTENGTLNMVRQGLPSFDIVGLLQENALLVAAGVIILLLIVICVRRR